MAGPFATAGEFAEFTGLPVPDDLARLQSLLQMASSVIRAYCRQVLSLVTADVYTAYPTVSSFLSLPERPVTAVSQVLVNGVATTDYYIAPGGRGIRSGSVPSPGAAWTSGATVTYSHGYVETSDEFSVFRTICLEAAKRAYTFDERGGALARPGIPIETLGYPIEVFLTEGEKATLDPFKRGPVR